MKIMVGVSNRHMHVTKETLKQLTGNDTLEIRNMLYQEGEYASTTTLTIQSPKGKIENVRVLGPFRNYNQIEISKTEAYLLGLNPPVRPSGVLEGSSPITLIGPKGEVDLENGVIIAERHIHLSNSQMEELGVTKDDLLQVKIGGEKGGILDNVHIKPYDTFKLELHLDTDDANAFLLKTGDEVEIIKK